MSEKEYPGSYVKTASILNAPTPGRFSTPLDLKAPDSKKKVHKVNRLANQIFVFNFILSI